MLRRVLGLALALGGGLGLPLASQQTVGMTSTGESGLFSLSSTETMPKRTWSLGLRFEEWDRVAAPTVPILGGGPGLRFEHFRESLAAAYGAGDRVEVFMAVSYDRIVGAHQSRTSLVNSVELNTRIHESGLGDARLGVKWRFGKALGGDLAVAALGWFPLEDRDSGVTTGESRFGAHLAWSRPEWTLEVGYSDGFKAGRQPAEFLFGVGYAHSLSKRLDWITEVVAILADGGDVKPENVVDLTTGARFWIGATGRWSFEAAVRTELVQAFEGEGNVPIGGLVGVSFFPSLFDFP